MKSKFWQWIDHKVRVMIKDKRMMVGTLIGFDKHLNLVLSDTMEYWVISNKGKKHSKKEIRRPIGLIVLRGCNVISIFAEKSP